MTTETQTAPVETVTPIKPSEAIRLGCLVSPIQEFDNYYGMDEDFRRDTTRSCALGAMRLGYGDSSAYHAAEDLIIDTIPNTPCHVCGEVDMEGWPPHLNDVHRWTRERIADYLEERGL
jgi:hypothetical protein